MKDHAVAQIEPQLEAARAAEFERAGVDEAGGLHRRRGGLRTRLAQQATPAPEGRLAEPLTGAERLDPQPTLGKPRDDCLPFLTATPPPLVVGRCRPGHCRLLPDECGRDCSARTGAGKERHSVIGYDLASIILLASIFNWSVAIIYVVVGLVLAVGGGMLIGRAGMEKHIEEFVLAAPVLDTEQKNLTRVERVIYAKGQVMDIVRRVWIYVLVGVGIGAAIHNWIPQHWVESILGQGQGWSVLLAVLIGVPMYADIFGTLPIAEALVARGVGLGTALAFMMSVTALSFPSLIMLKQVVRPPLLALFFGIITGGIILIGYFFQIFGSHFI